MKHPLHIFSLSCLVLALTSCTPATSRKPASNPMRMDGGETQAIGLVASDRSPVSDNAVWCGSFQICWNMAGETIGAGSQLTPLEPNALADELNSSGFSAESLGDEYCYVYAGPATQSARLRIAQGIEQRFHQESDILDKLTWYEDADPDAGMLFYTMLYREFSYEEPFEYLEPADFGSTANGNRSSGVLYFGAKAGDTALGQVSPLYYEDEDHFAAIIYTPGGDVLVLVRSPEGTTFQEMWENAFVRERAYRPLEVDSFACSCLDLDIVQEFEQLKGIVLVAEDGSVWPVADAIQTVRLSLDAHGGVAESEAAHANTAERPDEDPLHIDLVFDDSFALFLVDSGPGRFEPYLGVLVDDVTAYQAR